MTPLAGLVIVDKPPGVTSHDVVARLRRIAGTRKVGHAGTLDPMATGVLVVGIERATKLLGQLALTEKEYTATIRLGESTDTDDAQGAVLARVSAATVSADEVAVGMWRLTGPIEQVPSSVSAIKVAGQRSYARVRAGEVVVLPARPVTVSIFELVAARRPTTDLYDLDVRVECTTGTYVRALARDLGAALGVGGHLTALRRTRVGPYGLAEARTLEQLADDCVIVSLADAVERGFPRVEVSADEARAIGYGHPLERPGTDLGEQGPVGVFGPDGAVIALMAAREGVLRSLVVFEPATGPGQLSPHKMIP